MVGHVWCPSCGLALTPGCGSMRFQRVNTLAAIASAAEHRCLSFLLAGGHAVITHGFPRATFDLDLVVRQSDRGQWLQLALAAGYQLSNDGKVFLQFTAPDMDSFPLDLMLVNDSTFEKLKQGAVPVPSTVAGLRAVSLLHLLAMKCHAIKHGHAGRVVKDAEDVIRLIQNNRLDPESAELRELFQKYGTEEFYEKVRRACSRH